MQTYECLSKQIYTSGKYSIQPIRSEDRFLILQWRNEQLYHLRQNSLLTIDDQNQYFETVVNNLFKQTQPEQILFSYLENGNCIGYGGLVHINWKDKNAEISFILKTSLEEKCFEDHWLTFLLLIQQVSFTELQLYKIYTYAFDLRPRLYWVLERSGLRKEAVLKEHSNFNNRFIDVVIHSKFNETIYAIKDKQVSLRKALIGDAERLYKWVIEKSARINSIDQQMISWENHLSWFEKKMSDSSSCIYILETKNNQYPLGQIRIDLTGDTWVISYSIDVRFRRLGLGTEIVKQLMKQHPTYDYFAVVKIDNASSIRIFKNLGFTEVQTENPELTSFKYSSNR